MNYNRILEFILENKSARWWRNYPPEIAVCTKKISLETIRFYLKKIFCQKNDKIIGLYIHIPFCVSRCHFCKYYSEAICDKKTMREYIGCLEKELMLYDVDFKKRHLQNIYIGGGTPTILDEESWHHLFAIIKNFFVIDKKAQLATEGTPESCTYSKLKLLKELGINRFTIGVQTFDEAILNKLNRRHSISDIDTAFKNARKANFDYINADLLFGLPGETKKSFYKTIGAIVKYKPDSISPAFLELGRGVSFSRKDVENAYITENQIEAKALFEMGQFFRPYGYSNIIKGIYYQTFFCDKKIEAYNQNIVPKGSQDSTFAIGCHADSYLNYLEGRLFQLQYHKEAKLNNYIDQIKNGRMPVFSGIEVPEDELIRQYLIYCFTFFQGKINKKYFFLTFREKLMPFLKRHFFRLLKENKFRGNKEFIHFYQRTPYSFPNRNELLLFFLKYLYSPAVLKNINGEINRRLDTNKNENR